MKERTKKIEEIFKPYDVSGGRGLLYELSDSDLQEVIDEIESLKEEREETSKVAAIQGAELSKFLTYILSQKEIRRDQIQFLRAQLNKYLDHDIEKEEKDKTEGDDTWDTVDEQNAIIRNKRNIKEKGRRH